MKKFKGMTLVELLIVLGLMGALVGLTAAISNTSIRSSEFDRVLDATRGEIYAAQSDTIAGTYDSAWGVAFFSNEIVRYKGDDYVSRDPQFDLVTNFSNQVTLTGADEVAFTRPYGVPVTAVDLLLTDGMRHKSVTISSIGTIEIK
ncbi:MAG: prepilin-type N-terminal cleavage/methylation domain-containing protein [Patescibacteria group bacterium]|nr:prepilin-type N-terminal cleavage/methylation domain-containing protein [Patescibacteria group bacterium]